MARIWLIGAGVSHQHATRGHPTGHVHHRRHRDEPRQAGTSGGLAGGSALVPRSRKSGSSWPRPAGSGWTIRKERSASSSCWSDRSADRATTYQLPLTYRPRALAHASSGLAGTAEHGVLGRRWIYNGAHDPVLVAQLLALIQGEAEPPAQSVSNTPDPTVTGLPVTNNSLTVAGSAASLPPRSTCRSRRRRRARRCSRYVLRWLPAR
jgi:hypothetical protein